MTQNTKAYAAFTLIEISVVVLIIALLVGGIMTGLSLKRSSELNAVGTEAKKYITALNQFRIEYSALPGDISNATEFWGAADATPATCETLDKTGKTATCNGDGSNTIDPDADYEIFFFWQHLRNAGLIDGQFSGRVGPPGAFNATNIIQHTGGYNCPASSFRAGTAYAVTYQSTAPASWFSLEYEHIFVFGQQATTDSLPEGTALTPAELYNIDKKFDDGLPAAGDIVTRPSALASHASCTETTAGSGTDTTQSDLSAVYRLTHDQIACSLIYRNILE